ncbi:hypothetical protein LCGC14_2239190 [marine sediment metagenome]|uniref:Uncharacterized protein n=1 Tax=marine sediment metagenome TaxID=412755 RepID=A0A0F9DTI6_9ZZZZ
MGTVEEVSNASEKELRDQEALHPKSSEELTAYILALTAREHDYGTCVYAMSMAATAAFNYVAHKLGVTGFQASCADLDILRRTRRLKGPYALQDYANLLYPQYCDDEHFLSADQLLHEHREWLAEEAQKLLNEGNGACGPVTEHWKRLVATRGG